MHLGHRAADQQKREWPLGYPQSLTKAYPMATLPHN